MECFPSVAKIGSSTAENERRRLNFGKCCQIMPAAHASVTSLRGEQVDPQLRPQLPAEERLLKVEPVQKCWNPMGKQCEEKKKLEPTQTCEHLANRKT